MGAYYSGRFLLRFLQTLQMSNLVLLQEGKTLKILSCESRPQVALVGWLHSASGRHMLLRPTRYILVCKGRYSRVALKQLVDGFVTRARVFVALTHARTRKTT